METIKIKKVNLELDQVHHDALVELARKEERSIAATARRIFKDALVEYIRKTQIKATK